MVQQVSTPTFFSAMYRIQYNTYGYIYNTTKEA